MHKSDVQYMQQSEKDENTVAVSLKEPAGWMLASNMFDTCKHSSTWLFKPVLRFFLPLFSHFI